jgi:thiamine biosynthesis lipoprotein ApbE
MRNLTYLLLIATVLFLSASVSPNTPEHNLYSSSFENVLGTSFDLKVKAVSETVADQAEAVALAEIDRLSAILSSYDANSEFSRWQKTQNKSINTSPELMQVFQLFDTWKQKTAGALDPAVGAVIDVWKKAAKLNQKPDHQSINEAVLAIQKPHWTLDATAGTATHLSNTALVLNSFTKAYILELVAARLVAIPGIAGVAVNIGGDICIKGNLEENVAVADPIAQSDNFAAQDILHLSNKTIATSANYKRGFSINGEWFSHIIDPRNGMPANQVLSATVIADRATDAGALATAFNVLTPDESAALAESEQVAYQLVLADGSILSNDLWHNLIDEPASKPATPNASVAKDKEWDKNFEVSINFELARFEGRFRRPFIAVWVEDSKKNTVKTLALWYNKPRWLPDLKEWYRKNNGRYSPETKDIATISSATRPAGSYTLKWDGKTEDGSWVEAGNYTVYIEAAREHGTYQLMKQEVVCKGKAQDFNLAGNIEVTTASVVYKKK